MTDFTAEFQALTGHPPFPWQRALFARFTDAGPDQRFPSVSDIPTGLGKTSVIAVWLLALAHHAAASRPTGFPRRLVYVVNRRTVVDQSTREAERLRAALREKPELQDVASTLGRLAARPSDSPLAISTLRGQFADNAEWRDDPSCPAVVVGTVDMIGSRLLFSGYGRGFKSRPLHAAFLAQDALLVHDEAHLEPAFQQLVETIKLEQERNEWERGRFQVMALSATARSSTDVFSISDDDRAHDVVQQRIHAKKALTLSEVQDDRSFADRVLELLLEDRIASTGQAILVFARQVKDAEAIIRGLRKGGRAVEALTGTIRGRERDELAKSNPSFARFMPVADRAPGIEPTPGTVYLVCTSAGEVGVNLSADHMVCDLTPLDSMAQRLGRVNRFGLDPNHVAHVTVVVPPPTREVDGDLEVARHSTQALLAELPTAENGAHDASPATLSALMRGLSAEARARAFSPTPQILRATDILFDAWAMTTIRELPGRPAVQDYLHGVSEYEPPETHVAWRREVAWAEAPDGLRSPLPAPEDLLEDYPIKAHELLRDRTDRVVAELSEIAGRHHDALVWLVKQDGMVTTRVLGEVLAIADRKRLERELNGCTVVLAPRVGGLTKEGLLSGQAEFSEALAAVYDVADEWYDENGEPRRLRATDGTAPRGMRLIRAIDLTPAPEQAVEEPEATEQIWYWYVQPSSADDDGTRTARVPELLSDHLRKANDYAQRIASFLVGPLEARAVARAAAEHDLGKDRRVWQRSIGNVRPEVLAKSGPGMRAREITRYRHELGSILDLHAQKGFAQLDSEERDLVAHLIAAHHGRARPHCPRAEAFDPERPETLVTTEVREVPLRFARLQRRYGRWGLAYLESLVRASDALASQDIGCASAEPEAAQ